MSNCLKSIAEWWALPIIDMANNTQIPPMTQSKSDINPFILSKRNSVFKTSASNSHPNQNAHNFRSTIIENFLRSM
jgi:hypothetical protein